MKKRKCVYCRGKSGSKLSGEHIISRSVRGILYEDPIIHNISKNKTYKGEPIVSDVCKSCNSNLSPIDNAGRELAICLKNNEGPYNHFKIDNLMFLWLLKTHLNYTRTGPKQNINFDHIDNKLFQDIINQKIPHLDCSYYLKPPNQNHRKHFTTGGFYVSTHLAMAFLLLGILLLTACGGGGGGGDSADVSGTKNCTLGASALDSCTLK